MSLFTGVSSSVFLLIQQDTPFLLLCSYTTNKHSSTFKRLTQGGTITFDQSDKNFIKKLNLCRNYLRETHGFRIVKKEEVSDFLLGADKLLLNLTPDVKAHSYKDKFTFDFQIPFKLIFEVEIDIDSYIEINL